MNLKSVLTSLANFKILNQLGELTNCDVRKLLAKAHALREVRRMLKNFFDYEGSELTDEMILSGEVEINGEKYATGALIARAYSERYAILTNNVTSPITHIFNLYAESKAVDPRDVQDSHIAVLRARALFKVELRQARLGLRSDVYFIGRKHMLIAHRANDVYALVTLNGIVESEIVGKDISRYFNASPCMMYYSGRDVQTEKLNGATVQFVDTSKGDETDIRLENEVEQNLGQSVEVINERLWINLMRHFEVYLQSDKPHQYVDVDKWHPPVKPAISSTLFY